MKTIFQRLFKRKKQEKETIDLSPVSSTLTYTRYLTSQYSHRRFYTNLEILENLKDIYFEFVNDHIVVALNLGNDVIYVTQNLIDEKRDILYFNYQDQKIYDSLKRSKSESNLINDIFKNMLVQPDKLFIYFTIIKTYDQDYIIQLKFHTHRIEN